MRVAGELGPCVLPDNIVDVVRQLRRWTADWVPPHLPQRGFLKSATPIAREFDIYAAFIEQRARYSRRGRCGICGGLIAHGSPRIEVWPNGASQRSFYFHHDASECRS